MHPDAPPNNAPLSLPAPLYRFLTHGLRSPLAALLALLQQGLQRPLESASHRRLVQARQQAAAMLQQLDALNQTLYAPPGDAALSETLLENLLQEACDRARPQARAKQQRLQLQSPAHRAFVPQDTLCLVQALSATLQLSLAQAPAGACITLHCSLHASGGMLHIGYFAGASPARPSGSITHTLQLPTLVYDGGFRSGPTVPAEQA